MGRLTRNNCSSIKIKATGGNIVEKNGNWVARGGARGGKSGARGGASGARGGSSGARGGSSGARGGARGGKITRERSPIEDDEPMKKIVVSSPSKLNIKIATGTKDETESGSENDEEFVNRSNSSLDHFELTDGNNKKANFKEIKLNEQIRVNEKENKDEDDGMLIMKQVSNQYATSFAQNSSKINESNTDQEIKKKLLELQDTLKGQIDELKLLKSQQQQRGMFYSPQMGFQNQYVYQPAFNQYPLQAVDNNNYNNNNHFRNPHLPPYHQNPPTYQQFQHAPGANNHQHNDERPHLNNDQHNDERPHLNNKDKINLNTALEQKIRKESDLACSDHNFAVRLMLVFFTANELRVDNLNVYGKTMRGNKDEKVSLDPERVGFIKERVYNRLNGDEKFKKTIWNGCISAMNKKIGEIRSRK